MSISSSAVIAELNISVWTAAKLDKTATSEVLATNQAGQQSGSFKKNLLAGTSLRKDIADYAALCRTYHNRVTLPWMDRGGRLLPTSLFLDYKQQMNVRKAQFDNLTQNLLDNYDALKTSAQGYMGSLFNDGDYPPLTEIQKKFGFNLVFSPLAEAGDFRLDVPTQDLHDMQEQYTKDFDTRLQDAMRKPWKDLYTLLSNMSEKLAECGAEEKRRWYDSFVTNATQMCSLLSSLNITKDPKLEEARRDLERAMLGVDIETLKDSPVSRQELKGKMDTILKKFEW